MINCAVFGFGYWSPNVIRNILKNDSLNLAYICDISESSIKKANKEYPTITTKRDINWALKNELIDTIFICTPIETHAKIVLSSLFCNKNVLVQKPLCFTLKECSEIKKTYETMQKGQKEHKKLMVAHTFLYNRAVQEIKQNIEKIGKIRLFKSTRVNLGLFNRKCNVTYDLLPHDLSILLYLFPNDKIKCVSATGSSSVKSDLIDTANVSIIYESGFIASIFVSWVSAVKNREIIIVGSEKTVVYDDCKLDNKVCYYDAGVDYNDVDIFAYQKGSMFSPRLDNNEAIANEINHFVDCIKNNKEPLSNLDQGIKVVELIDKINQSIKEDGKPIQA